MVSKKIVFSPLYLVSCLFSFNKLVIKKKMAGIFFSLLSDEQQRFLFFQFSKLSSPSLVAFVSGLFFHCGLLMPLLISSPFSLSGVENQPTDILCVDFCHEKEL